MKDHPAYGHFRSLVLPASPALKYIKLQTPLYALLDAIYESRRHIKETRDEDEGRDRPG